MRVSGKKKTHHGGDIYVLKQELLYIIRTLPVDLNKYYHYEKAIDAQISLYKGVRQSDNRFLKNKKKSIDISDEITGMSEIAIALFNKIRGNL